MTITPMDAREDALLALAHAYGATVHLADLPGTEMGRYEADMHRILIRSGMSVAQRVSTLAHEVVHARRGDDGAQSECSETYVDEEAAGLVLTEGEYARAEDAVGTDPTRLARALDVTPWLIEAWQRRSGHLYHTGPTPAV